MSAADFLVEIGTEELPPKALRTLMDAFAANLTAELDSARLEHAAVHAYASPRRLAVIIDALAMTQESRTLTQKGPPVSVAFDDDGKPKPPALAFAKKCGVSVDDLGREKTAKGEWLTFDLREEGQAASDLLPGLVDKALAALPIPRRMRWGDGDAEFVRPVHWVVMLHGEQIVDGTVMGISAGNVSQGHRFHSRGSVEIAAPALYLDTLRDAGYVVADFEQRREQIVAGVQQAASEAGGVIVDGEALYDEVAALVEWPVPVLGSFDAAYLDLPRETVISTLTGHQRYFPVADKDGNLLPRFVTVANIQSTDPDQVRDGNERVIRPRLADAAFFWDSDRKQPLAARQDGLREVVYQRGLGSLHDKAERTATLARGMCEQLNVNSADVERAAMLCKCDLLSGMVGEFPELQGLMGQYYAAADGEPDAVAQAIGEHYRPRFAGDALPSAIAGQVLAVADKLDTIAGIFSTGKKPSGNRDPFALRRAALGIVRILIECELEVDLKELIRASVAAQPGSQADPDALAEEIYAFVTSRMQRYFQDKESGLATETFDAVLARQPASLLDFARRLDAVQAFIKLDAAASLAAANKRIANILKKTDEQPGEAIDADALCDAAEKALYAALQTASATVRPSLEQREYTAALLALAKLQVPVDRFFDDVMVMADDVRVRINRLALLNELRELFLEVADISRLSVD